MFPAVNLLRAFYRNPLQVHKIEDFLTLTKLADYYCGLKAVSYALDASFESSEYFTSGILKDAPRAIEAAAKLRNKALFHDLVVYCAGPFTQPKFNSSDMRQKYKHLVEGAHNRLCSFIAKTYWTLEQDLANDDDDEAYNSLQRKISMKIFMEETKKNLSTSGELFMPRFYRTLLKGEYGGHTSLYAFADLIADLLESNLRLNSYAVSGQWPYDDYFLSVELRDEDIPWDTTETDW